MKSHKQTDMKVSTIWNQIFMQQKTQEENQIQIQKRPQRCLSSKKHNPGFPMKWFWAVLSLYENLWQFHSSECRWQHDPCPAELMHLPRNNTWKWDFSWVPLGLYCALRTGSHHSSDLFFPPVYKWLLCSVLHGTPSVRTQGMGFFSARVTCTTEMQKWAPGPLSKSV